ncbi:MAG: ABC transporter ATP-binding protein [Cyanobacteriota bacterium]
MPLSSPSAHAPIALPTTPAAAVVLEGIWHRFDRQAGSAWVLQNLDLSLAQGELLGLLGPSGCGKTTLLRLIAGLERPDQGIVRLAGRPVAGPGRWLAPERRGVGMVFQDYALFPHLSAWRNACFGLGAGRHRQQDQDRVRWLLELVGLEGLADRYPHELSGGQRQRLALVRALVPAPAVLLLDEPFSNLDVEVRRHLRSELPALLRACGTSGVLVTHDPEEALAICDRIAVLRSGVLQQCATPWELVSEPANPFVGRFVLQANLLPVHRLAGGRLQTACGELASLDGAPWPEDRISDAVRGTPGQPPDERGPQVMVAIDALQLIPDVDGPGEVMARECLGRSWMVQLRLGDLSLRALVPIESHWDPGDRCRVTIAAGAEVHGYLGGRRLRPA